MATKQIPDQTILRQLLDYDPETGFLTWKHRPLSYFQDDFHRAETRWKIWNGRFAGKQAFNRLHGNGYLAGELFGHGYMAHRVIWKWVYAEDPDGVIDHINRNRRDNRIANLRAVSWGENLLNRSKQSNNTSGYCGVSWAKSYGRWYAEINKGGKRVRLGYFKEIMDAVAARRAAERELGFHSASP